MPLQPDAVERLHNTANIKGSRAHSASVRSPHGYQRPKTQAEQHADLCNYWEALDDLRQGVVDEQLNVTREMAELEGKHPDLMMSRIFEIN